jgi:hypothetical protein
VTTNNFVNSRAAADMTSVKVMIVGGRGHLQRNM